MEEKKQGKGLVVALVLFILTTLATCGYIVYDKVLTKDNVSKEVNTKKEENKELDINSDLVQNLFNTFKFGNTCSRLNIDDFNNNNLFKLRMAYDNIAEYAKTYVNCSELELKDDNSYCGSHNSETPEAEDALVKGDEKKFLEIIKQGSTETIDSKILEAKVHELFGSDYEYKPESFGMGISIEPSCFKMKYVKEKNLYVYYKCEGGGTCATGEQKLVSATKKGDKLNLTTEYKDPDKDVTTIKYVFKKDKIFGNYVFEKIYEEK